MRYLRAAIEFGGEKQVEGARQNPAFRLLARNVEFRELVGEPARGEGSATWHAAPTLAPRTPGLANGLPVRPGRCPT